MSSTLKTTKQYALAYIDAGFSLLPLHTAIDNQGDFKCTCHNQKCSAPAKHPIFGLTPHGVKDASSNISIVKKWFGGLSPKNIGIATGAISNIVVLDIDPRHGGESSLRELEEKYEPLPKTLSWQTGGGGQHIIFKHPGGTIRNSVGTLGEGLDIKADGGYIVAPPSRHKSGNYYFIPEDSHFNTPLAPVPTWLLKLIKRESFSSAGQEKMPIRKVVREQVPEGQRNSTIARVSGHLLAKRIDPHICLDLMLAFNAKYCSPPLDENEVMRTVASIERISSTKIISKI